MPDGSGGYPAMLVLFALFAGYVLGRVHAAASDPRRAEERKRAALAAAHAAEAHVRRLSPDVRRKLEDLISQGKRIDAIRDVRTALGIGLKEAKETVEKLRDGMPGGA